MRKDNNEWVVGNLLLSEPLAGGRIQNAEIHRPFAFDVSTTVFEVIPETVGQLCQYEGKEYWEGDYDKDGNMLYFCQRCQGWQFAQIDVPTKDVIFCHNCDGNFDFQEHINDFIPISNIHQHPTHNG